MRKKEQGDSLANSLSTTMHRRLLHASTRRQEEEEDGSLQCLCFPTVLASCKAVSSVSMFYLKIGREDLNFKKIFTSS